MQFATGEFDIVKSSVLMQDFIPAFYPDETKAQWRQRERTAIKMFKEGITDIAPYRPVMPMLKEWLDELSRVDAASFICKTELIKSIGGWKYGEKGIKGPCDWRTYSLMLEKKPNIKVIHEVLVLHR